MELFELTIHELGEKLHRGETTSLEITESLFERIEAVEDRVHSYITLMKDSALESARQSDLRRREGAAAGPLEGIPVAIKDLLCTRDVPTTCGSRFLETFIPPYDATVVEKLRQAGAVIVGKTNLDEFAMGSSTETSYYGVTRNPWDLERIPGGSSGGSAAAAAAGQCIASLGSDTGGSIRQPAAFCGVVGLKPTYGRVSRFGLVAFASSLDQIGPLTRDVEDSALMLNVIAGYDRKDSTSVHLPVPDYREFLGRGIEGWTIGIPREYFIDGMDPEIFDAMGQAKATMESLGADCREISLPHTRYGVAAYCVVAPAEASSNLARYDGVRYGFRSTDGDDLPGMYRNTRTAAFGAEVKRRIMIGTYALSSGYYDAYYKKASQVRALVKNDFDEAFKTCDIILAPTTPTAAFRLGEKIEDPLQMYLSDVFTLPANLAGIPAISVPCGFTGKGLPLGIQFLAGSFQEGKLLQAASAFERSMTFEKRRPPL
ncbi:MAG: Asp-tRNA(Asn)/Glu-tRNA(Gln) amidotransferase subunit GatA [Syntrophales bacterium]|nr:Asp-tRNA(Asn)/Glu-tRNA(Gln) amidotransferase subunit GatA [Syntrophales bacterium]MCK9527086.1 Asp-tRNA(Asn)/Glu-tRNA(Gln) amidotransferase subunit GatA [Syntrophales bacterium]MDX9921789.1 Asp-tRNA(Asn)/Glu-tRNA(Gln) amidotransferase subunit GatA [Syntrophales bacterium]